MKILDKGGDKMKILDKFVSGNGTVIQLEDWSEHNSPEYPELYGLCIAAYPIARNTGKYGEKSLEDLADHFYDGDKAKWYLGMDVEYRGW